MAWGPSPTTCGYCGQRVLWIVRNRLCLVGILGYSIASLTFLRIVARRRGRGGGVFMSLFVLCDTSHIPEGPSFPSFGATVRRLRHLLRMPVCKLGFPSRHFHVAFAYTWAAALHPGPRLMVWQASPCDCNCYSYLHCLPLGIKHHIHTCRILVLNAIAI